MNQPVAIPAARYRASRTNTARMAKRSAKSAPELLREPESFVEGMKAIDEGRVVDMEKALHEEPPA